MKTIYSTLLIAVSLMLGLSACSEKTERALERTEDKIEEQKEKDKLPDYKN